MAAFVQPQIYSKPDKCPKSRTGRHTHVEQLNHTRRQNKKPLVWVRRVIREHQLNFGKAGDALCAIAVIAQCAQARPYDRKNKPQALHSLAASPAAKARRTLRLA